MDFLYALLHSRMTHKKNLCTHGHTYLVHVDIKGTIADNSWPNLKVKNPRTHQNISCGFTK